MPVLRGKMSGVLKGRRHIGQTLTWRSFSSALDVKQILNDAVRIAHTGLPMSGSPPTSLVTHFVDPSRVPPQLRRSAQHSTTQVRHNLPGGPDPARWERGTLMKSRCSTYHFRLITEGVVTGGGWVKASSASSARTTVERQLAGLNAVEIVSASVSSAA